MLGGALCVGIAVQIACAGNTPDTLVGSEGLDGYTKYALFSFYGKRGSDDAVEQTQTPPSATEEAQTAEVAEANQTDESADAETAAFEEETDQAQGVETQAVDAEPQTAASAPAQSAPQAQKSSSDASQFYSDEYQEEDCGDYCK
jgi:hypothetical protein